MDDDFVKEVMARAPANFGWSMEYARELYQDLCVIRGLDPQEEFIIIFNEAIEPFKEENAEKRS